jgi:glycosyltransferase involved in cell wall biosynthesis
MANLLNEVDIFVDFSTYQGLGLTAMESMACGAAVIVPSKGGTSTFAHHEENALVVDTSNPQECLQALRRLIDDHALRAKLQQNSIHSVKKFYPERPAFNLLKALFQGGN